MAGPWQQFFLSIFEPLLKLLVLKRPNLSVPATASESEPCLVLVVQFVCCCLCNKINGSFVTDKKIPPGFQAFWGKKKIYEWSWKQIKHRPALWVRTEALPLPTSLQNVSASPCSSGPLDCNCHTWCCLTALTWPDPKCRRILADKETSGCHSWIHQAPVHPKAVCAVKWHHVLSPTENRDGTNTHRLYQQGIYELIIVFPFLQQGFNLFLQHLHFSTQHLIPGFWGIKFFFQFLIVFLESFVLLGEFLQWCKRK